MNCVECRDRILARTGDLQNQAGAKGSAADLHVEGVLARLSLMHEGLVTRISLLERHLVALRVAREICIVDEYGNPVEGARLAVPVAHGTLANQTLFSILNAIMSLYCQYESDWIKFAEDRLAICAEADADAPRSLNALEAFIVAPHARPDIARHLLDAFVESSLAFQEEQAFGIRVIASEEPAARAPSPSSSGPGMLQQQADAHHAARRHAFGQLRRIRGAHVQFDLVLDLDETLVKSVYAGDGPDRDPIIYRCIEAQVESGLLQRIDTFGGLLTVARPWALSFLRLCVHHGFRVFALTAGSQSYCDAIVSHFNSLGSGELISAGLSCRNDHGEVSKKSLSMLAAFGLNVDLAVGLDNRHDAWDPADLLQVLCVPDFEPSEAEGQAAHVLLAALDILLNITNRHLEAMLSPGQYLSHSLMDAPLPSIRETIAALEAEAQKKRLLERARTFTQVGFTSVPARVR